jgi:hypothetical protein
MLHAFRAQTLVHTHVWPFWALWGLSFIIILVLGFSQTARRKYPWCAISLTAALLVRGSHAGCRPHSMQLLPCAWLLHALQSGVFCAGM